MKPRNPENEPTKLERKVLSELKEKGLQEKVVLQEDQIRYFKPIHLTKECLFCHGSPKGAKDPLGGPRKVGRQEKYTVPSRL